MRMTGVAVLLIAGGLFIAGAVSAQQVSDIDDPLYKDLSLWQERGLISNLPPLRPYPIQLVRKLLETVQAEGDGDARQRATTYLKDVSADFKAHAAVNADVRSDFESFYQQYELRFSYQGTVAPGITFSGDLGGVASNNQVGALLPEYVRPDTNVVYDGGVAPLGSTGLTPRVSTKGEATFGSDSVYFQAGILRASFGPFFGDSIVLSPTAPQAGQFSVVIHEALFTYTSLLLDIAATNNDGSGGPLPNKFLSLHSIEVYPTNWLSLGIIESVVWGGRLEPLYLLPFPSILFFAQGMVGYQDNSFVGLSASVKMPEALKADFMLYVDDAAFNDLIKLDFNTMLVLAAQGGLSWTPHLKFLERLGVSYTMVTPYTYSHEDAGGATAPNYQNYTNNGQNMATSLEPDSDRIEVDALVRPFSFLDVTAFARLIRHGNGSEGIAGGGDGTIFDTGWVSSLPTFTPAGGFPNPPGGLWTRFLTQSVIEKTFQSGFDAVARINTVAGQVQASLGYTFEYSMNFDLGATNRLTNYLSVGLGLKY